MTNILQARVVGSSYTTFNYAGKPIAYLEGFEDSGQQAFSDAGAAWQPIHPLGFTHPVEIATSRVLAAGTINLTIRELWNTAVWEQLSGLAGTNNIVEIFAILAANQASVTCTSIIKPPGVNSKPRGKIFMNCLDGDTRLLTDKGTFTLADLVGQQVNVLGSRGHWTPAEIKSYGVQNLWAVTLTRHGREKTVWATPEHRWFVQGGAKLQKSAAKDITTQELVSGQRLVSTYRVGQASKIRPSAIGIQAGIVYGDGGMEGKAGNAAGVSLFGDKDAQLLKWFPLSPTRQIQSVGAVSGTRVVDLPSYFKAAPPMGESLSYLYGWLAGYFAADGQVDTTGSAGISSADLGSLQVARDVCTMLGIATYGISTEMREGFAGRGDEALYRMRLYVPDLSEDFFLIEEHRRRAAHRLGQDSAVKGMDGWFVKSVVQTERYDEVYCAEVPAGQAFTLEDNVLTGNCVIVGISDNDTVTVGALAVTKGIVVAYTHSTRLS